MEPETPNYVEDIPDHLKNDAVFALINHTDESGYDPRGVCKVCAGSEDALGHVGNCALERIKRSHVPKS